MRNLVSTLPVSRTVFLSKNSRDHEVYFSHLIASRCLLCDNNRSLLAGSFPMMRSVLLCDLDGTLADTAPGIRTALNHVLADHELPPLSLELTVEFVGDGAAKLIERAGAIHGRSLDRSAMDRAVAAFEQHYIDQLGDGAVLYPYCREALEQLRSKGWQLAICTNKPEAASRRLVESLEIAHLFEGLAGGDSLPARKPDPGHLLGLIDMLSVSPANCIMLGDSGNDAAAAKAAGLPVVLVSFGYSRQPPEELGADSVIDHYDQLDRALAGLS